MLAIGMATDTCGSRSAGAFRLWRRPPAGWSVWSHPPDSTPPRCAPVIRAIVLAIVCASLLGSTTIAQEPAERTASPAFDIEAATHAYLARVTPEEKARSDAYFEGGYWLLLWNLLYGLAVAALLLGTGWSRALRDAAARIARWPWLETWLYAAAYVLVTAALSFPLTVYQGFWREHQYGLATQTFGPWFRDQAVGLVVSLVLVPLLVAALYAVLRRAPRLWWVGGSVVSVLFLAFALIVSPVFIDPLFNEYTPLQAGRVRDDILSMARASGIQADDVYQFDASRQSTRISANVSGAFGTMRIRLNDNLLNRCTLPEIKAVMGHEIGHYALNHIYELLLWFGVVLVGGFAFVHVTFERVRRFGGGWGVSNVGDVAGLPLLVALLSVYMFVMTPALNTIIRTNEAEADRFGLHASREPDGFAEVALKLGEYRKLEPGPLEEWVFFDHPSGRSRIRMAMQWKAEQP